MGPGDDKPGGGGLVMWDDFGLLGMGGFFLWLCQVHLPQMNERIPIDM